MTDPHTAAPVPADPAAARPAAAAGGPAGPGSGSLLFVGNATCLIRWGALTLLTDPNFLHRGQRAYLGHGLVSKRVTEPALSVAQLPPLDAVVLSHLHGDHWDRVARRGLDRDVPILTTTHASKRLQVQGFTRAVGQRTWGSTTLVKGTDTVTVTALPARHAPGPLRALLPPVVGTMLEFGTAGGDVHLRLYLSGDTLHYDGLREIPLRFPVIDVGVLHLGGTTLPGGLMVTMDGRQGADTLELVSPREAVPVHYDDYTVFRSPLSDFRQEVEERGLDGRVRYVERGETLTLRPSPPRG